LPGLLNHFPFCFCAKREFFLNQKPKKKKLIFEITDLPPLRRLSFVPQTIV
jgi:hypothetical protein